ASFTRTQTSLYLKYCQYSCLSGHTRPGHLCCHQVVCIIVQQRIKQRVEERRRFRYLRVPGPYRDSFHGKSQIKSQRRGNDRESADATATGSSHSCKCHAKEKAGSNS